MLKSLKPPMNANGHELFNLDEKTGKTKVFR